MRLPPEQMPNETSPQTTETAVKKNSEPESLERQMVKKVLGDIRNGGDTQGGELISDAIVVIGNGESKFFCHTRRMSISQLYYRLIVEDLYSRDDGTRREILVVESGVPEESGIFYYNKFSDRDENGLPRRTDLPEPEKQPLLKEIMESEIDVEATKYRVDYFNAKGSNRR